VYYGVNGEEKGLFFSGVNTSSPLWAMLDIYGNTVSVEFSQPNGSKLTFS
jgi:protein neuralized